MLDKYQNCGASHHLAVKVSRAPARVPAGCRDPRPGRAVGASPLCSTPQEIKQRDEAECRAVEDAGKAVDALYLPGMYAFSKGLPA